MCKYLVLFSRCAYYEDFFVFIYLQETESIVPGMHETLSSSLSTQK